MSTMGTGMSDDAYMGIVQSPAAAKATADDSVEHETVKVYPLDKRLEPQ